VRSLRDPSSTCAPRILGRYHVDYVIGHWRALYREGYHQAEPRDAVGWAERGHAWVLADVPLDMLDFQTAAEAGAGRVQLAWEYAQRRTPLPPGVALYGRQSARRRTGKAYVADGNHRVLAAAMRLDCSARVFMQKDEYAQLVEDAERRMW